MSFPIVGMTSYFANMNIAQVDKEADKKKAAEKKKEVDSPKKITVPTDEADKSGKIQIDTTGLFTIGVVNEENRLLQERFTNAVMWGDFGLKVYNNFFATFNGGISFPQPLNGTINNNEIMAGKPVDTGAIQYLALGVGYVNTERNSMIMLQGGKINNMLNPLQALNEHITWTKNFPKDDTFRLFKSTLGPIPESEDSSSLGLQLRGGYSKGIFSAFTTVAYRKEALRDEYKAMQDLITSVAPSLSAYSTEVSSDSIIDNWRISWDVGLRAAFLEAGLNMYYGRFLHPYKLATDNSTQEFLVRGMQYRVGAPIKFGDFCLKPAYVGDFQDVVDARPYEYAQRVDTSINSHFFGGEVEYKMTDLDLFGSQTKLPWTVGAGYFCKNESLKTTGVKKTSDWFHQFSAFTNLGTLGDVNVNFVMRTELGNKFNWDTAGKNFAASLAFTMNTDFVGTNVVDVNKWLEDNAKNH